MSNESLTTFVVAIIIYAFVGNFLPTSGTVALSILLIMGALLINTKQGHNFLTTIGVK